MITKIYIENFKGIGSPGIEIELKPITLLFGANSAGKSTVIQALHYAREILKNKNINPEKIELGGNIVDFGGFKNVVNNQVLQNRILIKIDFDVKTSKIPYYDYSFEQELDNEDPENLISYLRDSIETAFIKLEIFWDYGSNSPRVNYSVGFNNELFGSITEKTKGNSDALIVENLNLQHEVFLDNDNMNYDEEGNSFPSKPLQDIFEGIINFNVYGDYGDVVYDDIEILAQNTSIPLWGKSLIIDDLIYRKQDKQDHDYHESSIENFTKQKKIFQQALNIIFVGLGECLNEELNNLFYIGPIREVPVRKISSDDDKIFWSNGLAAWDILAKNDQDFLLRVNMWLYQFQTKYEIVKKERKLIDIDSDIYRKILKEEVVDEIDLKNFLLKSEDSFEFFIRDSEIEIDLKPQDIGVGLSQVIPIIVGALNQRKGIIAIEQPELHIHPQMQVELGDLFIQQISIGEQKQFLIETHSEHLMLRILRRIDETNNSQFPEYKLYYNQISVYYFEVKSNGTTVTGLPVDETGEFTKPWPKGFFEERAEELFR